MKTIEELKTRIKELSNQTVEFSKKASEICLTDRQQANLYRRQALDAGKLSQVLIQELKSQQNYILPYNPTC